ncbi:phosphate/phosphite/phosphonate ABC transporter substrate-binding protein [Pseudonocardia aurantiaca]|uniref:Phosphate/phosphite/phosphonate ABC transporter substrate-binding protein n=1 Tax=Pseudonocardia aurantiaca TaxID=75290 RepID=A0ABW4FEQ6_9PSEU
MRSTIRRAAVAVVGAALLALTACGQSAAENPGQAQGGQAGEPGTLVFAAVPSEESTSLQQSYQTVISLLEKETGATVQFQNATDYAAVIEGMRAGKIDVAMFGPFSYVLAKNQDPGITPVAAMVDTKGAQPGYKSYGITKADSTINDLAGFAGHTVCFVDPASTSGYLYPTAGLMTAGVNPETGVKPTFAGGHDASVLAVASGQCDAGFSEDVMVDTQLIKSGQLKPGELKIVWKSDTIPGSPIAIASDVAPELRQKIVDTFTQEANVDYLTANGVCSSADQCKLGSDGAWGYVPVDDALYNGIRQVCDVTKAKSCTSLG